jgi:RNA polymerase sigma factor (sigma-70 family)
MSEELAPRELLLANLGLVREQVALLAKRHRLATDQQEELESYVRLRLLENDFAILRKFQHRCSLRTYLAVVVPRLFRDHCNHEWGKWRASAQARRLGPQAQALEELLHRDGLSLDEAQRVLAQRGTTLQAEQLEELALALPPRVQTRPSVISHGETVPDREDPHPSVESSLLLRHAQVSIVRALASAFRRLQPRERLLLRLRFVDRLSVLAIARVIGGPPRTLNRRLRDLLVLLRRELQRAGVEPGDVGALLADVRDGDLGFEEIWPDPATRPSIQTDEHLEGTDPG